MCYHTMKNGHYTQSGACAGGVGVSDTDPAFLEREFICINVLGVALMAISHLSLIPRRHTTRV